MTAPSHWVQVRLGDLVHFVTSGSRNWGGYYNETGALFIRVGDLARENIEIDLTSASRVLPPQGAEGERTAISVGDLLISITADLGLVGVATESLAGGFVNQHIALARPSQLLDSAYLGWFLASPQGQAQLLARDRGAVKAGLRLDDIKDILIPLPPAPEQQRISAMLRGFSECLSRIHGCIESALCGLADIQRAVLSAATNGSLSAYWRASRQGLGSPLLAQHTPAPADAGLFEIPSTWQWVKFAHILSDGPSNGYSPRSGSDATGSTTLKLSATTQGKMILDKSTTKRVYESVPFDSRYWLQPGDILIQRANTLQYVGATAMYEGPTNTYIYPDLMMRVRIEDAVLREFAVLFLNSDPARSYLRARATGTAGSMPKISAGTLRELPFPLPPADEVPHILKSARELRRSCENTESELYRHRAHLGSVRSALLSAAFSGSWDTKNPDDEPVEVLRERVRTDLEQAQAERAKRKRMKPSERSGVSLHGSARAVSLVSLLNGLGGISSPEELWRASELPIDEFYKALRESVNAGTIRETAEKRKLEVQHAN